MAGENFEGLLIEDDRRQVLMTYTLKTSDGKIVKIDKTKDSLLYDAPHNPPNTGTTYTRGTDLYAHKARSGTWYFYQYDWSMWQEEGSGVHLIDEKEAVDFLIEKNGIIGHGELSDGEKERALEIFGRDIFEETA